MPTKEVISATVYVTLTCLLWFREVPMHHEENCEGPQILLITFQGEWKLYFEGPMRGTSAVFCVGINEELVPMRNCVFEVL